MPIILKNHPQPAIPIYAYPFIQALRDLSGDRINTSYGVNGIPFTAKLAYARWIKAVDEPFFINMINEIDAEYVDRINKKIMKRVNKDG